MEIEINEYIRTKDGVIAQLEEITTYYKDKVYWFDATLESDYEGDSINFLRKNQFKEYILKHSFNIIDLLEVGDVIRYKELASDEKYGTIINEIYISDIHSEDEFNFIKEEVDRNAIKILSIVTKEQFESIKYEV